MFPQTAANEQYLQSTVLTATPAKLRWMLLDRAVVMVEAIRENRSRNGDLLVDEWTIRLRDILGELLGGVARGGGDLAEQVADLYVFLLQELTHVEQEPGTERIEAIGRVLRIERETWQLVVEQQTRANRTSPPAPHKGVTSIGAPTATVSSGPIGGSLNLQA